MNEVEDICDRIAIIDHGKFVACGTEQELISTVSDSKALKISTEIRADFPINELISKLSMLPDVKKARIDGGEIFSELTPRETDIVRLIAEGLSSQQIAEKLFISNGTVRNHISAILEKPIRSIERRSR